MQYTVELIIRIIVAIGLAILLGNGCVVVFNRLPVSWFSDYKDEDSTKLSDEGPSENRGKSLSESRERILPEKLLRSIEEGRQRIPSTPWKYIFTGFFGVAGVYLTVMDVFSYQVGVIVALAIVLEMAIADALYQIIPDQFAVMLAVSSVGFFTFFEKWWEPAAGAALAAVLMLAVYGVGRLIYKRDTIGGGDIKFYLAIGCVTGRVGVIAIYLMTSVIMLVASLVYRMNGRDRKDSLPMLPYAFVATSVYMLFLWDKLAMISL